MGVRVCEKFTHPQGEQLGAGSEPISQRESLMRLLGIKMSKRLLLKVLFPCPKQLCQQLD